MLQDENQTSRRGGTTTIWDSGIGGLSSTSNIAAQLEGKEDSLSVAVKATATKMTLWPNGNGSVICLFLTHQIDNRVSL